MNALPEGLRLHNPFNMRATGIAWDGLAGAVDGFCHFIDDDHGLRAGFESLINAQRKHGRNTIDEIVVAYAPDSENDTAAYIRDLVAWTGFAADQKLRLDDALACLNLGRAIIRQEQGQNDGLPYFDDGRLKRAIDAARSAFGWPPAFPT